MLEGFVYVFQFSDRVKIGFSARVEERKKQVEAAAGQRVIEVFSAPAPAFVEKLAHDKLKQFRLVGEYFNIPFPEAVKVVKELAEAHKITPVKEKQNSRYLENVAKAIVVINGDAITAGSNPIFFATFIENKCIKKINNLSETNSIIYCSFLFFFILQKYLQ